MKFDIEDMGALSEKELIGKVIDDFENESNLNWDGTRTSSTAPTLLEWPSNPPTFEGTWSSTYLTLRFFQAGRRVWGDYGTRGWMQGEIDLDTGLLEGTFYNSFSDRYGRIRFTLNGGMG